MIYFDQDAFGVRLRKLRKQKKMTQEELACKLGICVSHYRHIEYGEKGVSVDLLLIIADLFNVSTDYLLTGKSTVKEKEIIQLNNAIELIGKTLRSMQSK